MLPLGCPLTHPRALSEGGHQWLKILTSVLSLLETPTIPRPRDAQCPRRHQCAYMSTIAPVSLSYHRPIRSQHVFWTTSQHLLRSQDGHLAVYHCRPNNQRGGHHRFSTRLWCCKQQNHHGVSGRAAQTCWTPQIHHLLHSRNPCSRRSFNGIRVPARPAHQKKREETQYLHRQENRTSAVAIWWTISGRLNGNAGGLRPHIRGWGDLLHRQTSGPSDALARSYAWSHWICNRLQRVHGRLNLQPRRRLRALRLSRRISHSTLRFHVQASLLASRLPFVHGPRLPARQPPE